MTDHLLKEKTKYGILHIPTSLILRTYLYDEADVQKIDNYSEEIVFDTKELAETALTLCSVLGLELKRGRLTDKETSFFNSISLNTWIKGIIPATKLTPILFTNMMLTINHKQPPTTTEVEWTPRDAHNLMSKFNHVECFQLPNAIFFEAVGISMDNWDYEEFKKKTGYRLNRHEIYPKVEFEIIEITKDIQVKRPSPDEFKGLVLHILKDTRVPQEIADRFKQYIKD
jgi:hypothetical protein